MPKLTKRNRKLLLAGIAIIIGATFMRFAWIIISQLVSTFFIVLGATVFIVGIIFFANTFFNRKDKY